MQQSKAFSFYAHGLLWTRNKLHVAIDEEEDYKNYLRIKPLNVLASYLYCGKQSYKTNHKHSKCKHTKTKPCSKNISGSFIDL